MGAYIATGNDMRSSNSSSHAVGKALSFFLILLASTVLIFFLIGFFFYKPPKIVKPHDVKVMPMERSPDAVAPAGDKDKEREAKEDEQLSLHAKLLPLLPQKLGKVRVATRYEGLLAQMDSALEGMGPIVSPDLEEDCWERFMIRDASDPEDEGIAAGVPLAVTVRERMAMIKEVLDYASSQAGISADLLAAVAWAETTIFPYAINVRGKTYYFTSRRQALKALQ